MNAVPHAPTEAADAPPPRELTYLSQADDCWRAPVGKADLDHEVGATRKQVGIGVLLEIIEGLIQRGRYENRHYWPL